MKFKLLFVFLISISACHCHEEVDIPDPCAACKGDYICVENRCECPPGTVDLGRRCIENGPGVMKADLKNTPLACFGSVILEMTPPTSNEGGWDKMKLHYPNHTYPYNLMGGPNGASYTIGVETDVIQDDFFYLYSGDGACDSLTGIATNAKFYGTYYKNLGVLQAKFIRWQSHPLTPVDTFEIIFKH